MINSGALPKVALSRPPTASPVRVASCSVANTMSRAMGMMEIAAEKNTIGADTLPACSSATVMGMNTKSQCIDGFRDIVRHSVKGCPDWFALHPPGSRTAKRIPRPRTLAEVTPRTPHANARRLQPLSRNALPDGAHESRTSR